MSEEVILNFLEEIVDKDLKFGKYKEIITRFPPEPNGYLHLGHAKSICLNFGLSLKYGGKTNLRFDDTNPTTESIEYVENIKNDVKWLGFEWNKETYASDYFDQLYEFACLLIKKQLAYVDDSHSDDIALQKGTPEEAGINSPYRKRAVEENLQLFEQMKAGKYKDGEKVLRAKIDMGHSNMHMRDPILYRIKHQTHHRTGNKWCIYPMYDFAHGQSDSIEKVTHSICTLEFIPHRELYDWLINRLEIFPSQQYEFARLNLTYTIMSKRKLLELVNGKYVSGWDDPRMPTICGMRRRGYSAKSIRNFCERIGVAKRDNLIDLALLEFCVREDLNKIALRRMVVFNPVKVLITNYETDKTEYLVAENKNDDGSTEERKIPFCNELFIETEDFKENPPKNYFRLSIGKMVRLKNGYIIECEKVIKNAEGTIQEIHCRYIPTSKSGSDTSGIKVKGTLHWVSANHAVNIEVRLYEQLFKDAEIDGEQDFDTSLNPNSLTTKKAYAEPAIINAKPGEHFQFLRMGYFSMDTDSTKDNLIFNRTVTLRDTWAKQEN